MERGKYWITTDGYHENTSIVRVTSEDEGSVYFETRVNRKSNKGGCLGINGIPIPLFELRLKLAGQRARRFAAKADSSRIPPEPIF